MNPPIHCPFCGCIPWERTEGVYVLQHKERCYLGAGTRLLEGYWIERWNARYKPKTKKEGIEK